MDTKYCGDCGVKIDQKAKICPKCALKQHEPNKYQKEYPHKNPAIAAVLSALWVGIGQIYNGETVKGILLMVSYFISILLISLVIGLITVPVVWIYGIYDAYNTAKINNGKKLDETSRILKKTNYEDNKEGIKSIKPKIKDTYEKSNLNESKSENDLSKMAFRHKYLKKEFSLSKKLHEDMEIPKKTNDKAHRDTPGRMRESDLNYDIIQKENNANIDKKIDFLLRSGNYAFVKDFVDRWGNDDYTKQSLKILRKRLDNKGFNIDEKDLKPLLIYIMELEQEKEASKIRVEKKLDSLLKSDNYTFVKDFVNRWGNEDYTKQSLKILHKRLDNKGFNIDENDLKPLLIHIRGEQETELNKIEKKLNIITKDKKLHSLLKSDSYMFVKDFVNRFGNDNYPDVLFKRLHKQLCNKGFKIDENDLKLLCIRTRELEQEKKAKFKEQRKEFGTSSTYKSKKYYKTNSYVSINKIDSLSGFEFENFLKELFQKMGYQVKKTPKSGDQGADLIISKYNEKIAVQAKRYKSKVGNGAVQEVVASIAYYGADKGMVVTNSQFTKHAIDLANFNQIRLIDRSELNSLINKHLK